MIKIDDGFQISFTDAGHFVGEQGWVHPTITVPTYELIYMTEGTAYIFNGDEQFVLNKNDLILLPANVRHGGYKNSDTATGFYWLHFTTNNISYLKFPKLSLPENSHATSEFFKRMIHYQAFQNARNLLESSLLNFLLEYTFSQNSDSKLCHDVLSYIRLNISAKLKVTDVSARFGYNADYLSKLLKKHFSFTLKESLRHELTDKIKGLLTTTTYSIKEIADECGFIEPNYLIKFFRYNQGCSPTTYRNRFYIAKQNNS